MYTETEFTAMIDELKRQTAIKREKGPGACVPVDVDWSRLTETQKNDLMPVIMAAGF
jgi:hypothetical protein